jgi:hypothetical protein
MPGVGFEPTISVFQRAKTLHFLDRTATVIGFFEPQPSLKDSARLHPVFTSLNFVTIIFFRASTSALRPVFNLEDQVPVFMSPRDRLAQLYPQAPGSFFVSYDSQTYT